MIWLRFQILLRREWRHISDIITNDPWANQSVDLQLVFPRKGDEFSRNEHWGFILKDRFIHPIDGPQRSASQGSLSVLLKWSAWFKNGNESKGLIKMIAFTEWENAFYRKIMEHGFLVPLAYNAFTSNTGCVTAGASSVNPPWTMEHIHPRPTPNYLLFTIVPKMIGAIDLLPMDFHLRFEVDSAFSEWKKKTYLLVKRLSFPCRDARRGFPFTWRRNYMSGRQAAPQFILRSLAGSASNIP